MTISSRSPSPWDVTPVYPPHGRVTLIARLNRRGAHMRILTHHLTRMRMAARHERDVLGRADMICNLTASQHPTHRSQTHRLLCTFRLFWESVSALLASLRPSAFGYNPPVLASVGRQVRPRQHESSRSAVRNGADDGLHGVALGGP